MATFYEGDPILTVHFSVSEELYVETRYREASNRSHFTRRESKALLFVILSAVMEFGMIFWKNVNLWLLMMLGIVFLFAAWFFFFMEPRQMQSIYHEMYRSNRFLKLRQEAVIYRDSIQYRNEYECFAHYYTDFSACVETGKAILLCGGKREYLLIAKEGLSPGEEKKLSEVLSAAFASKYRRIPD